MQSMRNWKCWSAALMVGGVLPAFVGLSDVYAGSHNCGAKNCSKKACASKSHSSSCKAKCSEKKTCSEKTTEVTTSASFAPVGDLPPNANPGECFAKVYSPPEYKTVTERVCIRPEGERVEIIPARYETVEERVMVKKCSKRLVEEQAQYKTEDRTIQVKPESLEWVRTSAAKCTRSGDKKDEFTKNPVGEAFCLVKHPAEFKTIQVSCLVKPASVREIEEPAQYETVRRQKLVSAACTRKIKTAAEFDTIERTVMATPGAMKWERIICDESVTSDTVNAIKNALTKAGEKPGPADGQMSDADWNALTQYQQKNRLPVGYLTLSTLNKLQVASR